MREMTIEELSRTTRDADGPRPDIDIETLVRTLVNQAIAAEQQSTELAERVALLENQCGGTASTPETNESTRPNLRANVRRQSARVSFVQRKEESIRNTSTQRNEESIRNLSTRSIQKVDPNNNQLKTFVRVAGNDAEEALADRILLIENQLEFYDQEKSILVDENNYSLPESTFSLLITHHPLSVPFGFSVFTIALSIACLSLTLMSSISNGTKANRLGIPAGVDGMVCAAQFIGAIVGVLMENEIPQGLQLIANGAGYTLLLNGNKPVQKRVIISSIFRLVVGYLFLSSLLINIAQNSDVIQIFYDLLALEFVENIDDISYALAKRGFFGRSMLIATNESHNLEVFVSREMRRASTASINERRLTFSGLIASNNRVNRIVRSVYFLNATILLVGLAVLAASQKHGLYRCNTINVLFDEEIWEHAYVRLPDDSIEARLLIYSYFNGIYQEEGYHDGYPRYIEQNKNDGTKFGSSVRGAEIIYCDEIGSWVFMHPDILTSPYGEEENECGWLWRSHETQDYDLLSTTDGAWEAWTGEVKHLAFVSITCTECWERSDCNYHGHCGEDKKCICYESHFGDSCEFELPCQSLATEKALAMDPDEGTHQWKQENPIRATEHRVYNRPLYVQEGLSGEPFDMRMFKIVGKAISSSPSIQPSSFPSILNDDNILDHKDKPPPANIAYQPPGIALTAAPNPVHSQNEYDKAPDFADWDDFFESPSLHDGLAEMLEDYRVVISYSGSRFYGTIVGSNATLNDVFHRDYHAFWSESFDVDRTFIISDTAFTSSPVGIDFFEMRRRANSMLNPNIHFSYGPFGALVPLMSYEGTGFFHCLDETSQPSSAPSFSRIPSSTPSSSGAPTSIIPTSSLASASSTGCFVAYINIRYDENPRETSWKIFKTINSKGERLGEKLLVKRSEGYSSGTPSFHSQDVCLPEGTYEFIIEDSAGNGFSSSDSYYTLKSDGVEIANGGKFSSNESTFFSLPVVLPKSSPGPRPRSDYQTPASTQKHLRPVRLFRPSH